ncbi:MAG: sulfatase-like hydrolase/transferase [Acidobacteria bacterium]|nr:sulfatase-like hydrolase/transferase [Acidobacteriota bacterium]
MSRKSRNRQRRGKTRSQRAAKRGTAPAAVTPPGVASPASSSRATSREPVRARRTAGGRSRVRSGSSGSAATRRRAVAALLVAGTAAALVWLWSGGRQPLVARTAEQNVLLVTIDTLRADALGSYGGPAETPNLDRLAAAGVRFEFAHAHAVMALPSHASILTGLYPFEHGIHDNAGYRLPEESLTLAAMLRAEGFATGAFVGAFPLDSRFGLDNGFDVYDDRFGHAEGPYDLTIAERPAEAVVEAARTWIESQPGQWFAWVHLFDPHAVYSPPPPFDARYAASPYHGEVAYTDHALGPLLDVAGASQARPTLVVVTADHGEAFGEHGERTHGLFAYEATLRVPLVVAQIGRGLAVPDEGAVSAEPVRHVDIVPSVLDALSLPAPALPGRSLLDPAPADTEPLSYFEALSASLNRGWAPLRGVLAGRDKYIDLPVPELYDVRADPAESSNLAAGRAGRARELEALLADLPASDPLERRVAETAEVVERLRSLGYAGGTAPARDTHTEDDDPKRLAHLDAAIHRGVDLYRRGRPREAIEVYREVIAERPDLELAHRHLAYLHWSLGEAEEAVATLRRVRDAGIASPAAAGQLGMYLAESGAADEAVPLLEALVAGEGPPDVNPLNALGVAYARRGDHERALETFERVIELDPDSTRVPDALLRLGTELVDAGDLGAARSYLERFVGTAPASYGEDIQRLTGLLESGG